MGVIGRRSIPAMGSGGTQPGAPVTRNCMIWRQWRTALAEVARAEREGGGSVVPHLHELAARQAAEVHEQVRALPRAENQLWSGAPAELSNPPSLPIWKNGWAAPVDFTFSPRR